MKNQNRLEEISNAMKRYKAELKKHREEVRKGQPETITYKDLGKILAERLNHLAEEKDGRRP